MSTFLFKIISASWLPYLGILAFRLCGQVLPSLATMFTLTVVRNSRAFSDPLSP